MYSHSAWFERVWRAICLHQTETFFTKTALPFSYLVEGEVIRPCRGYFTITKEHVRYAFDQGPEARPSDLKARVPGASYVHALLHDERIGAWHPSPSHGFGVPAGQNRDTPDTSGHLPHPARVRRGSRRSRRKAARRERHASSVRSPSPSRATADGRPSHPPRPPRFRRFLRLPTMVSSPTITVAPPDRSPHFSDTPTGIDADTQVLLHGGVWKHPHEITPDDRLATVNPAHALLYHRAADYDALDYAGDVYRLAHRSLDLVVGPAHRMPVRSLEPGSSRLADRFALRQADGLGSRVGLLASARQCGDAPALIALPEVATGRGALPARLVPVDALLQVLGYFVGDGWVSDAVVHRVTFAAPIVRKRLFIGEALRAIGCRVTGDDSVLSTADARLHAFLAVHGFSGTRAVEKRLPGFLFDLDHTVAEHCVRGLLASDGHTTASGSTSFYSSSPYLRDAVQALFFGTGRATRSALVARAGERPGLIDGRVITRRHDAFVVTARKAPRVSVERRAHVARVPFAGLLHRFHVPPWCTMVVRRNGLAVVVHDGCVPVFTASQLRAA
jgi:hypothetical protein